MLIFICRMLIILFLFIPVLSTYSSSNSKTVDPSPVIQAKDNLLTVKVRDIPLKKILIEIAKQKSIKFTFYASVEELIVADFSRLPMAKGLKKLLRDYNYTFIKGGEHEIRKVVILTNGGESRHRRMEPAITYTEDPPLYENPYDNKYPHIQEDAEDAPGSIGSEIDIEYLSDALQNADAGGKISAVRALGVIGEDMAIQALERALTDGDEAVRDMALEELRRLNEEE